MVAAACTGVRPLTATQVLAGASFAKMTSGPGAAAAGLPYATPAMVQQYTSTSAITPGWGQQPWIG